jgi:hypothetical protein
VSSSGFSCLCIQCATREGEGRENGGNMQANPPDPGMNSPLDSPQGNIQTQFNDLR